MFDLRRLKFRLPNLRLCDAGRADELGADEGNRTAVLPTLNLIWAPKKKVFVVGCQRRQYTTKYADIHKLINTIYRTLTFPVLPEYTGSRVIHCTISAAYPVNHRGGHVSAPEIPVRH